MSRCINVPEVVQTSGMDCGPAALASLLQGYGINASYSRLRDVCHTNVDGTSIDDLESVAKSLGLNVRQVMVPADQLLLPAAHLLPAIVVTELPGGYAHFVVAWRRRGSRVQIMDPAVGRRWVSESDFLNSLYVHEQIETAAAWYEWASSDECRSLLHNRLRNMVGESRASRLMQFVNASSGWQGIAKLDAAARMAASLCSSGIRRGAEALSILNSLLGDRPESPPIPQVFWSVRAASSNSDAQRDAEENLIMRGAVLIHCAGRAQQIDVSRITASDQASCARLENLVELRPKPFAELWSMVPEFGYQAVVLLSTVLALLAAMTIGESLLFRSLIDAGRELVLPEHRMFAVAIFLLFSISILALENSTSKWLLGLGRTLECKLRVKLLEKIPKLSRDYIDTRPTSDTAARVHSLTEIRSLPMLLGAMVRSTAMLLLNAGAIAWFDPDAAPLAFAAALSAVVVPLIVFQQLREIDLCVRTHSGALSLYYYDALIGLSAIRAHRADRAVRREHDALLLEWVRSNRRFLFASIMGSTVQAIIGYGLAVWLLFLHAGQFSAAGSALLMAYWALSLPALGEQIMSLVKQIPGQRSVLMRLLEPLNAPEELIEKNASVSTLPKQTRTTGSETSKGVHLSFLNVSVVVSGRKLLDNISVEIPAGCHVGIVGVSGAGKSTLLGLLLGGHRAVEGSLLVDNELLTAARLEWLRSLTTWVDPSTQLWNRSLVKNLTYGSDATAATRIGEVLEPTELMQVLERLPLGLQTELGESGCLLSGGEGQRVRFARAALHQHNRLAILDEPFRGLDRSTRSRLLTEARTFWAEATLLCVTHDISETTQFDRVLVVEDGQLVEFGDPQQLLRQHDSRYQQLFDAEQHALTRLWQDHSWTNYALQEGRLTLIEPLASNSRLHRNVFQEAPLSSLRTGRLN